jgi:hypothetical protein
VNKFLQRAEEFLKKTGTIEKLLPRILGIICLMLAIATVSEVVFHIRAIKSIFDTLICIFLLAILLFVIIMFKFRPVRKGLTEECPTCRRKARRLNKNGKYVCVNGHEW